jgi:hypothetical protein
MDFEKWYLQKYQIRLFQDFWPLHCIGPYVGVEITFFEIPHGIFLRIQNYFHCIGSFVNWPQIFRDEKLLSANNKTTKYSVQYLGQITLEIQRAHNKA